VKRARFAAPARREFLLQVAYYDTKEPGLGSRFTAAVEEATLRALAFPLTGSRASNSTRRVFVRDFPFAVVYREEGEGIVVLAIAHHARRPEYWRQRVPR
jgi:toxin ParE1/3/4